MQQSITIHTNEKGQFTLNKPHELNKLNPKELLLYSTALCAGMTTLAIAEKERVKPLKLEIKMSGELDTEKVEGRSKFESFHIAYNVECRNIGDQEAVSEVVLEAHNEKCGVIAMLRKIAPISHEISVISTE